MIENLQNLLNAGDELRHFSGILSGSLSFIFGNWTRVRFLRGDGDGP